MAAPLTVVAVAAVYIVTFSSMVGNVAPKAIFTFGDSIVDAGNNHFNKNCTAQADFPPYGSSFFHRPTGRFTNGRTVADFISEFMGIELQSPFLEAEMEVLNGSWKSYPSNGINFASAGSGLFPSTNLFLGVIPIQQQLQQFKTLIEHHQFQNPQIAQSIFLLESGSNDIFNYFLPFDTPTLKPDAYIKSMLSEVSTFVSQIYKLGARRIAVFSLGPVGCVPARVLLPDSPVDECDERINSMVRNYNSGLEALVKGIPLKFPGAVAVFGDVYGIVQRFRALPSRYGAFLHVLIFLSFYFTLRMV
ncbi:GDSL esterase/lipase 6 [Linum grandiflorum]